MTVYQCDSCDSDAPGGVRGTSFLVRPDGQTYHFCSGACLRAYVNGAGEDWPPLTWRFWLPFGFVMGAAVQGFLSFMLR